MPIRPGQHLGSPPEKILGWQFGEFRRVLASLGRKNEEI
jgi:hypothetical protein